MTAVAWWTLGTAVFVMAAVAMSAGFRLGPVRWAGDALARRREAELRAEKLLLSWLSPSQRDQYRSRGWFDVVSRGGNRYRICPWKVTRLDIPRCAYCIEAVPRVPAADEMLANKLVVARGGEEALLVALQQQLLGPQLGLAPARQRITCPADRTEPEASGHGNRRHDEHGRPKGPPSHRGHRANPSRPPGGGRPSARCARPRPRSPASPAHPCLPRSAGRPGDQFVAPPGRPPRSRGQSQDQRCPRCGSCRPACRRCGCCRSWPRLLEAIGTRPTRGACRGRRPRPALRHQYSAGPV